MVARFTSPWRLRLRPASYNGARFHVDVDNRASGRRIVAHEYPKKDIPYAEDMGRRIRRFVITAYVIGPNYLDLRDALINQLEAESPGWLIHPTLGEDHVACETYSVTERRQQGGYAEFQIAFVEAGQNQAAGATTDTQSGVNGAVNDAVGANGNPTTLSTAQDFVNTPATTSASLSQMDLANTFMNSGDITKIDGFPAVS